MTSGAGALPASGARPAEHALREQAQALVGRGETLLDGAGFGSKAARALEHTWRDAVPGAIPSSAPICS